MTSSDDLAALLARVALRDRAAFEQVYHATCAHLLGIAFRIGIHCGPVPACGELDCEFLRGRIVPDDHKAFRAAKCPYQFKIAFCICRIELFGIGNPGFIRPGLQHEFQRLACPFG